MNKPETCSDSEVLDPPPEHNEEPLSFEKLTELKPNTDPCTTFSKLET